jgi:hypothetical protein
VNELLRLGRLDEVAADALMLLARSPGYLELITHLEATLVAAGRFEEAAATAGRAAELARGAGELERAEAIARRAERYRAGASPASP